MGIYTRIFMFGLVAAACSGVSQAQGLFNFAGANPWVGSWFGMARELCATGEATCPQASLFMTPSICADGNIVGNDNFGPHTTAHGQWKAPGPLVFIFTIGRVYPPL